MTNSDDLYRGKSLYNIRGSLKYGISGRSRKESNQGIGDVEKLSQRRLLLHFLCDGENSECVVQQTCECLQECRYGQRYLQTLADNKQESIHEPNCERKR